MQDITEITNSNEFIPYRMTKRSLDQNLLLIRDAIHKFLLTRPNAIVIDVGTGGGQLAAWAAECETVVKVYALDDDPLMISYARQALRNHPKRNLISLIQVENLLTYSPPENCDLLLCEVISTGLIQQPQMPLINHFLSSLKPSGRVMPDGLVNEITLLDFDFSTLSTVVELPIVFDAHIVSTKLMNNLSLPTLVNQLSFHSPISESTIINTYVEAINSGWAHSLCLESQIVIGDKYIPDPNPICHPLIMPLSASMYVEQGQKTKLVGEIIHRNVDATGRATACELPRNIPISIECS